MADETAIREEMVETCLAMNAAGINQGTSGNLSVRSGDGFLVTPSSVPYDRLLPELIVSMGFDGSIRGDTVSGGGASGGRPSSEWRFHRDILKTRPDVSAVLHCHSAHATALACQTRGIPAVHYMVAIAGGSDIRCADYATFGTRDLSDAALAALAGRRACLLAHHGQIALGASMTAALDLAIEVETLARIYLLASALGEPPVLSDDEMARVSEQMRRMSYGQPPNDEPA